MRHLVDLVMGHVESLAFTEDSSLLKQPKTIVDIGTDHGILPIALAATGQFDKVLGVDVSETVLKDGAMALHQEVKDHFKSLPPLGESSKSIPPLSSSLIEFRLGDGLAGLDAGDADVVCLAGMGVHTMLKIVAPPETDRVECQLLVLQPTNSKPRNLVLLYDTLQEAGWQVVDERIEKLSSRWYLSVAFSKAHAHKKGLTRKPDLPGTRLQELGAAVPMKETFNDYIQHHQSWLKRDKASPSGLHESEARWLETYESLEG